MAFYETFPIVSSLLNLVETIWENRGIAAGFQGAGTVDRMASFAIYNPRIISWRYEEGESSLCLLGYFKSRDLRNRTGKE